VLQAALAPVWNTLRCSKAIAVHLDAFRRVEEWRMCSVSSIMLGLFLILGAIELSHADALKRFVDDLKSADAQTRATAIQHLGESGDIRAVQPLLAALSDENALVRRYALDALQRLVSVLDDIHGVVKRWLQTLIKSLQNEPSEEVITVARPVACVHVGHGGAVGHPVGQESLSCA
jgi:hypothetical protein